MARRIFGERPLSEDFRLKLKIFAERAVTLAQRCNNEESTKLFLILPFLHLLGYDDRNPDEVCPEHGADFSEKYKNRVDFAIMRAGKPVTAIECKTVGLPLKDERGQLRSYFNAAPTVKMEVITDGLIFEFYADSDEPNIMDPNAFLSLDLREVAKGKIENSIEEGLKSLQKTTFDPENIGAEAKRKLIFQNLIQQIARLAEEPSEAFVRLLLTNAGLSYIRSKALVEYVDLTRSAFREFVSLRILQRLDLPTRWMEGEKAAIATEGSAVELPARPDDGIVTTATELDVFAYVRRRLSFLVKDEALYDEIDHVLYHDYKGKFVVFYKKERSGRLFDFREGGSKKFEFEFGLSSGGQIATDKLSDIDQMLYASFTRRVEELAMPAKKGSRAA